jgi:hypothetical protein
VDDGYEPVSIIPEVKDNVIINRIGILERTANFHRIVPPNLFNNANPRFDFVRRIRVIFHCLVQMLTRNDMHGSRILHNM